MAKRLEWELNRRGLSYAKVAGLLTAAGHPTHPSAIHKLLHSTPRRRLTLNEAAAIAEVLGLGLEELVVEQETFLSEEANKHLHDLRQAGRSLQAALETYLEVLLRMSAVVEDGIEFEEASQSLTRRLMKDLDELQSHHEDAVDRIYGLKDFMDGKYDSGKWKGPQTDGQHRKKA